MMMSTYDRENLLTAVSTIIREAIEAAFNPIAERVAAIELRPIPVGRDGKDADPEMVRSIVDGRISAIVPTNATLQETIREAVLEEVTSALQANVKAYSETLAEMVKQNMPKDGKDADMDVVQRMIAEHVKTAVDAIPKPTNGKDADLEEIKAFINSEVARSVNSLPKPKDGEPGEPGKPGKDAPPIDVHAIGEEIRRWIEADCTAGKIRERWSQILNEKIAALPPAKNGEPGAPGKPGKDGDSIHPDTVRLMVIEEVKKEITAMPKPRDGEPGKPGKDALSLEPTDGIDFDKSYVIGQWATHNGGLWRCMDGKQWKCMVDGHHDVEESHDGERTITITHRWSSGKEKTFTHKTKEMKQRGIWQEDKEYTWGDVVTRGGSQWYCQVESTKNQPKEEGNHDWVLIVRRGRDAKFIDSPPAPRGPVGLK